MTASRPFITDLPELLAAHGPTAYREVLRVPALSLGLFAAEPGHHDTQTPHAQDEVYVVVAGSATLVIDGAGTLVTAGSTAYVPARVPHRFEDITEDLRVVVVFAPPLDPNDPPRSDVSRTVGLGHVSSAQPAETT